MKPLVLYHAHCWDGFCAAWVARKALGDIEAIPVQYGAPAPIDFCDRDVYILDFSYPRAEMKTIIGQSSHVVVLDHHKTAQAELSGLAEEIEREGGSWTPTIVFDMNKSGGRLAWEYFAHPQSSLANCPVPWLVEYTEDRDLWRHALPNSREINASLRTLPLDFIAWDLLHQASNLPAMVTEGAAILRREKQIINDHLKHARDRVIAGHIVPVVNATVLFSDIAGELAKGRPFGACYFDRSDGMRQWSLRSDANGLDVAEIARTFGGGGHKNAAGYQEEIRSFT